MEDENEPVEHKNESAEKAAEVCFEVYLNQGLVESKYDLKAVMLVTLSK